MTPQMGFEDHAPYYTFVLKRFVVFHLFVYARLGSQRLTEYDLDHGSVPACLRACVGACVRACVPGWVGAWVGGWVCVCVCHCQLLCYCIFGRFDV